MRSIIHRAFAAFACGLLSVSVNAMELEQCALDGSNGIAINGVNAGDGSGFSVSSAGDFNGDGFDDVIVGGYLSTPNGRTRAGASYIVFGSASGFAPDFELASLDGLNGFVLAISSRRKLTEAIPLVDGRYY